MLENLLKFGKKFGKKVLTRFLIYFILIESTFAVYSIRKSINSGRNYFLDGNKAAFVILSHSLPYFLKYHFGQSENEAIKKAFENKRTLACLEDLIKKEKSEIYTEIPFFTFLNYENNMPFLTFYPVEKTVNKTNSQYLLKIKNSPEKVKEFVKKNEKHFKIILGENIYKNFLENFEKNPKLEANKIVELYIAYSDSYGEFNLDNLIEFFSENWLNFKGKLVGITHIHFCGPPSDLDKKESSKYRSIIINPCKKHYLISILEKGKLEEFYIKK